MELPDGHPDAMVPAARRFRLPDRLRADALRRAQPSSDAWADVHPDEVEDVPVPVRTDARCAEKLAVLARGDPVRAAALYWPPTPREAVGPCKPDAARSAA
jgi:hypothetical protein